RAQTKRTWIGCIDTPASNRGVPGEISGLARFRQAGYEARDRGHGGILLRALMWRVGAIRQHDNPDRAADLACNRLDLLRRSILIVLALDQQNRTLDARQILF